MYNACRIWFVVKILGGYLYYGDNNSCEVNITHNLEKKKEPSFKIKEIKNVHSNKNTGKGNIPIITSMETILYFLYENTIIVLCLYIYII